MHFQIGNKLIRSTATVIRCTFLLIAALALSSCHKTPTGINHAQDFLVRGYLVATVGGSADQEHRGAFVSRSLPPHDVFLPGVRVFLQSSTDKSPPVTTDLSGRFTLHAPSKGTYQICWTSPLFGQGCTGTTWTMGNAPLFVSKVHLTAAAKEGFGALFGRVTDLDGTAVRTYDPFVNVNAFTRVEVRTEKGNVLGQTYVNNFGEYLYPYVLVKTWVEVVASIENGRGAQELLPDAPLLSGFLTQLNLKVANHPPKLSPLAAGDGAGHRVQSASVGDTVDVSATARDDDPTDTISYRWQIGEGNGTLSSQTGANVKWKLPAKPGRYTISVVAYDGHGGYDKAALSLLADGNGVPFTGRVVATNGSAVAGAKVEIVGNAPATTDSNGLFAMRVTSANRYVLNIRAAGYALDSQIYDHGVTGGRWILHHAQTVTFDPTKPNTLTQRRDQDDCVGPDSMHARPGPAGSSIYVPQWQDGNGHVVDAPSAEMQAKFGHAFNPREIKLAYCGPGVTVTLPANAIVDSTGATVTAPVTAQMSTVDLASPQQMPGDDGVLKSGGGAIESFGAGSFDLPPGMKLRDGVTGVTVTIPVDRLPKSGGVPTPPTVPLLSYNETKGDWIEEGTLTLTNVAGVMSYVGEVKHFSPFNADNVKDDSSACLRLFSPSLPSQYNLEVAAPYHGTGAPKIVSHVIDQTDGNESVIYNLPNNVNVTMTATTIGSPSNVLGVYVANSGNAANPNTSPLAPQYVTDSGHPGDLKFNGYIACNNFVVMKINNAPDAPFGGEFLHGLGVLDAENLGFTDLTNAAPNGTALINAIVSASKDYYTQVDPAPNKRDTFDHFKTTNGFQLDPNQGKLHGEYVAQYANSGDLGFGRDMHCRETDTTNHYFACYVTNYGTGYNNVPFGGGTDDQDDANAAGTRSTVGNSVEVATVAMEYSPIEGDPAGDPVVKFFVYKKNFPNPGDYGRSISANLDGRGERPVPQLCMACHGGFAPHQGVNAPIFATANDVKLNARFLPFDYRLYTFPSDATLSSSAQDPQFKHLNQDIVDHIPGGAPANDPIREVVHVLYNDAGHLDNASELLDSPVTGWQTGQSQNVPGQQTFYNHVLAWSCRGCHVAQPFTQIQFNTSDELLTLQGYPPTDNRLMLGTVQNRVCGDYLMPHALRTHDIFWGNYTAHLSVNVLSLNMPQEMETFGSGVPNASTNWKPNLCTSFVSSGASHPSQFYEHVIQPIFNGKCVGCHVAGGAAGFLDLTEGQSFANIQTNNVVVPGDDNPATPGNILLLRVTSTAGNRMPQSCNASPSPPTSYYTCLTPTDILNIKAWIKSGAN